MKVRVPGKLFLAGEYAVLHPGQPGIVLVVDRWLLLRSEPAEVSRLEIPAWDLDMKAQDDDGAGEADSGRATFVRCLYGAVLRRLPDAASRHLVVEAKDGDLLSRDLGLGTSAALAVALVRGLGVADDEAGLELACAAHLEAQGGRGSGLDVAACWAGRSVVARSRDRRPPVVKPIAPPKRLFFGVLHSGRRIRTAGAIRSYTSFAAVRRAQAERFRSRSAWAVAHMEAALRQGPAAVVGAMEESARLLAGLAADLGEAPPVSEPLRAAIAACGGAVKSCGALGGDCLCVAAPSAAGLERARALAVSAGCEDLGLRPVFEVTR